MDRTGIAELEEQLLHAEMRDLELIQTNATLSGEDAVEKRTT
jgi:hypothetical protein